MLDRDPLVEQEGDAGEVLRIRHLRLLRELREAVAHPPLLRQDHRVRGMVGPGKLAQIFATGEPERVSGLMLIDPVSYDSWPSET